MGDDTRIHFADQVIEILVRDQQRTSDTAEDIRRCAIECGRVEYGEDGDLRVVQE